MVSMLNGPIPAHPHYDKNDIGSYIDMPVPRVRPEARDIATKAQGTVGFLLQVEGHRVPTGFRRTRTEPKNHLNENIRRMRQIQRENKRREQNRPREQPVKALWKSSKFENVPPRVFDFQQESPCAPRPHSAHYLRAHSRTGWNPEPRTRPASAGAVRPGSAASARSASPSLKEEVAPRSATARELRLVRHNMNYLQINGKSAKHSQLKRSPSLTALDDLKKRREEEQDHYKKGVVPKYLLNRQKQWKREEEERKANEPDPDLPEGHKKMPDEERKATLKKLQETEQQLLQQLQSMPVRTDTLRIRTRKEDMEKKLSEVAEAIKIFSRPKVFVKIDD